ncbi:MAG: Cof-type HAD-IIB family hydrolase [Pseudomonadales bacterium]|nr:Cof-type HAD-IIB family hydrolase [Pseudomonadales bacterium]
MKLVVFDMDGTLLNAKSELSRFTGETLALLRNSGIHYTVATGRTLQAALGPIRDHQFALPHVLKNGAIIWCPERQNYSHSHLLTQQEVWHVITAMTLQEITPFVFTLEANGHHSVHHGPLKTEEEAKLAQLLEDERHLPLEPLRAMSDTAHVINLSGMGPADAVQSVIDLIAEEEDLVAYTGQAIQDKSLRWLDIHHSSGSKGDAVSTLRDDLGYEEIIVFGDGKNDLSMFEVAEESYAPENADPELKEQATGIVGHHDEDGVARFLRERFDLD